MFLKSLTALLLLTTGAVAHEALVAHSHPHMDWSLTTAIVLALGAFIALIALPLRATRQIKVKKNDPR
jgi:protein-S-isoprenylcysteine O-methyltransferase Ste14